MTRNRFDPPSGTSEGSRSPRKHHPSATSAHRTRRGHGRAARVATASASAGASSHWVTVETRWAPSPTPGSRVTSMTAASAAYPMT